MDELFRRNLRPVEITPARERRVIAAALLRVRWERARSEDRLVGWLPLGRLVLPGTGLAVLGGVVGLVFSVGEAAPSLSLLVVPSVATLAGF